MPHSFVILWSQGQCDALRTAGREGGPIEVLFGGPHQSAPRFSSFGVVPGDFVIPVFVRKGVLHLLARFRVQKLLSVRDYLAEVIGLPKEQVDQWGWSLQDELWATRPADRHRLPGGCTNEAAVGTCDAMIRLDRAVPPDVLERMRVENRRGEQRGLKHVVGGILKSPVTLKGRVYRLSSDTARDFDTLLADKGRPPIRPATVPVPKRGFYLRPGEEMRLLRRGRIEGVLRNKGGSSFPIGHPWHAEVRLLQTRDENWYSVGWDVQMKGHDGPIYGDGLHIDRDDVPAGCDPADWAMQQTVAALRRVRCVLVEYGCSFTVTGWEWSPATD